MPCTENPLFPPALLSPPLSLSISLYLSFYFSLSLSAPIFIAVPYDLSIGISVQPSLSPPPFLPFFQLSLFLSFFSFSCPSEWSLRECVSPCLSLELFAHHAGLRGWEGDTITGQFFSPRRVRSIGKGGPANSSNPETRRIEILHKSGKFSSDSSIFSFPDLWKSFDFFFSLSFLSSPLTRPILRPESPSIFAFNRIILTRLCFIRAARSVCSGITSTQGKKTRRR